MHSRHSWTSDYPRGIASRPERTRTRSSARQTGFTRFATFSEGRIRSRVRSSPSIVTPRCPFGPPNRGAHEPIVSTSGGDAGETDDRLRWDPDVPPGSAPASVPAPVARIVEHMGGLEPDEPAVRARERERLRTPVERFAPDRVVERDPLVPAVPVLVAAEGTGHARSPTPQEVEDGRLRRHSLRHCRATCCSLRSDPTRCCHLRSSRQVGRGWAHRPCGGGRALVGSWCVCWTEPSVTAHRDTRPGWRDHAAASPTKGRSGSGYSERAVRAPLQVILPSDTTPRYGPMLSECVIPGCGKLTMGGTCVEHDSPVSVTFPRGRPHRSLR